MKTLHPQTSVRASDASYAMHLPHRIDAKMIFLVGSSMADEMSTVGA